MNKDLRLSRVLLIVILAIILILVSLNISQLSLLLLLIPIPFALIGTLSNLKNNIISLSVTFLSLMYFTKYANAMDIFINSLAKNKANNAYKFKAYKDVELYIKHIEIDVK